MNRPATADIFQKKGICSTASKDKGSDGKEREPGLAWMSKRALFVLDHFGGGGAQRSIIKYIIELMKFGYDVTVITLEAKVDFTLPPGFKWLKLRQPLFKIPALHPRIQARQIRRLIDSEGGANSFDIKMSTMLKADRAVSALKDKSFIFRFANDYNATLHRNKHTKIVQKIKKVLFRNVYRKNKILCVSEEMRSGIKSLLRRDDEYIRSIYNPFNFEEIQSLARVDDRDMPSERYIIHVGRPSRQKRHDVLIAAFKQCEIPHKLVLLGRTNERVRALVSEAAIEDRVVFIDFKENPYPLIAHADALILSSDYEGLPGVVIESLICGTPVVSTRCKYGPSEILIGPQARFLVEPGDVEGLARAIRTIVSDPPDLSQVSLEKFQPGGFVRRLEEFAALK